MENRGTDYRHEMVRIALDFLSLFDNMSYFTCAKGTENIERDRLMPSFSHSVSDHPGRREDKR